MDITTYDAELKKTYTVRYVEPNIIEYVGLTDQNYTAEKSIRFARLLDYDIKKILADHPNTNFFLVAELEGGIGTTLPKEARKIYIDIVNSPRIVKTAAISESGSIKNFINFIATILGKGNKIRVFSKRYDAEEWFKEK